MDLDGKIIDWLLEPEDPSVRYRTLKEILDYDEESKDVSACKNKIAKYEPVKHLLETMHQDGYWLQKNTRTGEIYGDDVVYGSFATTHFCLSYLAEAGLNRELPSINKAAERYLSLQKEDGDWLKHFSCLYSYNVRTFIKLGFREDDRVQRSIDLMLNTRRSDGGYLCETHEGKYKRREVKSCVRGSLKALMAFSEIPEYWEHERCKEVINYFLRRNGVFKMGHEDILVNKDIAQLSFPITWRANLWEVLYALSKMGYGKDQRLEKAWELLFNKETEQGKYILDWTPTMCLWKIGEKGQENKWITFYVMLAKKYAGRK